MKYNYIKLFLIITILFIFLIGCNNEEVNNIDIYNNEIKIGYSQGNNNTPWRVALFNSISLEAKKNNYNLLKTNAEGSLEKQKENIKNLIDNDIDYLIITPVSYEDAGITELIENTDIKVIFINDIFKDFPNEKILAYINLNPYSQGQQAANLLIEEIGSDTFVNIIELKGEDKLYSTTLKTEGFRSKISNMPNFKIIRAEYTDGSRSYSNKLMEKIIQDNNNNENPNEISAIFAHNDEIAIGAVMALMTANIINTNNIKIISIDGEQDALKAIMSDYIYATVSCTPKLGDLIFNIINNDIAGNKVNTIYNIDYKIYTKINSNEYKNINY